MAKAVLEFDLNDPDDRREHKLMLQAADYSIVLYTISQEILRGMTKYGIHPAGGRELTKEEYEIAQYISDRVHQAINERGLEI
jgi:hypothetical protein